ncbi:hypothetical protein [Streptomyces pseudovenezuelae]|uniref:hypothetical protein n=1 Tax=Streptomyces pseudovenezuelae TaxID=67350 RepID=UPI002E3686F8|nr:hypothetical protein [Streptomyces pseudovenezuelae]
MPTESQLAIEAAERELSAARAAILADDRVAPVSAAELDAFERAVRTVWARRFAVTRIADGGEAADEIDPAND